jgi:hypothetical protein
MRNSTLHRTIIGALTLVAAGGASAQNWEFTPRLELGYEFNDNYRLDFPGNEIEVSGALLDVRLPLALVGPVRKFEIAPRVRATYFPDETDEDSDDYYLSALFEQRTQRNVFGINGDWSREDVVRSELPSADIDDGLGNPTTGDAGRVIFRNERDRLRVQPYWRYDVSQRNRAEAGGHYLDADYKDEFEGAQSDYTDAGVYAGWSWLLSQRSSVTLRGRASRYETSFDADGYGVEGEWRSDLTETSEVYVRLGAQQTDVNLGDVDAETSVIAGLGGQWNWPTTNLFADLTRSVGPNAAGAIVERNQLRLRLRRALQPRLSFIAGARASHDEALNSETYPERDYLTGEVGFDWRLTRAWSVVGAYNYIWQEYSDEPSDSSSNALSLGLVYEPGRGDQ